jgi:hypothetical protein
VFRKPSVLGHAEVHERDEHDAPDGVPEDDRDEEVGEYGHYPCIADEHQVEHFTRADDAVKQVGDRDDDHDGVDDENPRNRLASGVNQPDHGGDEAAREDALVKERRPRRPHRVFAELARRIRHRRVENPRPSEEVRGDSRADDVRREDDSPQAKQLWNARKPRQDERHRRQRVLRKQLIAPDDDHHEPDRIEEVSHSHGVPRIRRRHRRTSEKRRADAQSGGEAAEEQQPGTSLDFLVGRRRHPLEDLVRGESVPDGFPGGGCASPGPIDGLPKLPVFGL